MRIIIGVGIQTMRLIIGPTNRGCPPTTPHWRADAFGDSYADADGIGLRLMRPPNTSVQRGLGGVPPQMELVYA